MDFLWTVAFSVSLSASTASTDEEKTATSVTLHPFQNCTQELDAAAFQTLSDFNMNLHIQETGMAWSHSSFSSRSLKCTNRTPACKTSNIYEYLVNCGPANIREAVDVPVRDRFRNLLLIYE